MKLFTPNQTKTYSQKQTSDDVVKIAYLQGTLSRLQAQTNDASAAFSALLAEQRKIYSEEKIRLQDEIRELVSEVKALEARKTSALIPITGLKAQAQAKLVEAEALLKQNQERSIEIEELQQLLAEKLDAVSLREQKVEAEEIKLAHRIEGARAEADTISAGHRRLNQMLADFQKEVSTREPELALREASINQREIKHAAAVDEHNKRVAADERSMNDRRAALERGFEELKRLKTKK